MNYIYSPLRYPGGKGALASSLADIILYNNLEKGPYFEPYAGGAGAALYLLFNGFVEKIHLNDADYAIYAFWKSVLNKNDKFLQEVKKANLSIDEWYRQRKIIKEYSNHSLFEIGFAAFFLNRCNRSGIISNAGPIGGYNQNGKWKLDVRFNKFNLCQRIERISKYKKKIHISNLDAIDFLKQQLPRGKKRKTSFVYIDPPYITNGKKLYMNYYNESDHKELASYMEKQKTVSWVMTYDNVDLIKKLYKTKHIFEFNLNYSLQEKKKGNEVIIFPKYIIMPKSIKIAENNLRLSKAS